MTNFRTILVVLAVLAITAGVWVLNPNTKKKVGTVLKPDDVAIVRLGEMIYEQHCAACHGADLQGQADWKSPGSDGAMPAPPHDETGHTWHHTDALLFEITKFSLTRFANMKDYKTNMPAYEDVLSDYEIIAVLSYIKSTWSEQTRLRHDRMNKRSRQADQG